VGVDGRTDLFPAGLDLGHEPKQAATIVRLGKTLAQQQSPAFELGVGVEETIGRQELDPRSLRPPGQQLAQDPGGRGLAHCHGTGDSDDERGPLGTLAEEVRGDPMEPGGGADIEVEQP